MYILQSVPVGEIVHFTELDNVAVEFLEVLGSYLGPEMSSPGFAAAFPGWFSARFQQLWSITSVVIVLHGVVLRYGVNFTLPSLLGVSFVVRI